MFGINNAIKKINIIFTAEKLHYRKRFYTFAKRLGGVAKRLNHEVSLILVAFFMPIYKKLLRWYISVTLMSLERRKYPVIHLTMYYVEFQFL